METKDTVGCEEEVIENTCAYQEMVEKADKIVLGFALSAGATGAVPIPFVDAPLLVSQQAAMMLAINNVFGFEVEQETLKSLAAAALGVSGTTVIGKTVTSNLLKLILLLLAGKQQSHKLLKFHLLQLLSHPFFLIRLLILLSLF